MPKTGTSSIQEYLFHQLRDPDFLYLGFGEVNAARALATLCLQRPEQFWAFRWNGDSGDRLARLAGRYRRKLQRGLSQARRQQRLPILSAEVCWAFHQDAHERLRDLLAAEGFQARVLVYLRPYLSQLESSFQQNIKWSTNCSSLTLDPEFMHQGVHHEVKYDYVSRLQVLEAVYGFPNLTVRLFRRDALQAGCAVQDFCAQTGIRVVGRPVNRANDALSLDALRILYAYRKYAHQPGRSSIREHTALLHHLQELGGGKLRLHPVVVESIADQLAGQDSAILERHGIDLRAQSGDPQTDSRGIREEADLFRFSQRSLDWLAAAADCQPLHGEGEALARQAAAAVDRLRRRVVRIHWRYLLRQRIRRERGRWRHRI